MKKTHGHLELSENQTCTACKKPIKKRIEEITEGPRLCFNCFMLDRAEQHGISDTELMKIRRETRNVGTGTGIANTGYADTFRGKQGLTRTGAILWATIIQVIFYGVLIVGMLPNIR